ncbi:MAG TPA: dynamin family protein [Methylophilaceae bacterium]|nr:dynamin family protein [Methylophilaceae bacterium]
MSSGLEQRITDFQRWRDQLSLTIAEYRDWLEVTRSSDAVQELRLYDMAEALKRDHLVLAFVAEFSRGKTETINALFFSDFNQRLLPCEVGRTTMCPTEIFWDESEEPYIKLLPINTRKQSDSLSYFKSTPAQWTKMRLDISSASALKEAFQTLVQQKEVSLEEAKELGLWNAADISMAQSLQKTGKIDVPVWRHALINFPHPLLKSGLVILDTPGLNTLGTEPELTLSIIPNAHAVVFLLATDTGVTKSDMHIWTHYIRDRASRKLAVLNKIDILWDEMKSQKEIEAVVQSQVTATARQLGLPAAMVLAISAQKALVARIRKDQPLLERSGIQKVEQLIADSVIAAKHEILGNTIINEASTMLKASRKFAQSRLDSARTQLAELQGIRGQNRDAVQALLAQITADHKVYEGSVKTFTTGSQKISSMGDDLLKQLNPSSMQSLLQQSRREIGDSWTTVGLTKGMKALVRETSRLADQINQQGIEIKGLADELYLLFEQKHGFDLGRPPVLDMESFRNSMHALEKVATDFCSDPLNMMTEKHFLVRRFFHSVGNQAQAIFDQTARNTQRWLQDVLSPLKKQIAEHKDALQKRTESLMQVHKDLHALEKNLGQMEKEVAVLHGQSKALDRMLLNLVKSVQPSAISARTAEPA